MGLINVGQCSAITKLLFERKPTNYTSLFIKGCSDFKSIKKFRRKIKRFSYLGKDWVDPVDKRLLLDQLLLLCKIWERTRHYRSISSSSHHQWSFKLLIQYMLATVLVDLIHIPCCKLQRTRINKSVSFEQCLRHWYLKNLFLRIRFLLVYKSTIAIHERRSWITYPGRQDHWELKKN